MLDDYIKDLIESNNRVIIPNFGAFLLRATSKNKNKKELAAKVQDIYFSPFLKFNDELLVNHIMKKENVDQKGAMEKINEYVKQIEEKVKNEGSYKIGALGEFTQDNQGKIQFQAEGSVVSDEKDKKVEPKKEEKPKAEEKKKEEAPQPKTINEKAKKSSSTVASKAEAEEDKKEEQKKEEPKKEEPKKPATATSPSKDRPTATRKPPPPGRPATGKPKKGSNKGLVLSIAIGVPVAILFIWAMLNFDTVENIFSKDDKNKETLTEKPEKQKAGADKEKTEKQTEKKTEQEKEVTKKQTSKKPEKPTQATKGQKKFYIVAGSFKKKQNAINFRKDLIEQGYEAELIGERNGMHAVSYASFKSKKAAETELKRLREQQGVKAWLLYY